MGMGGGPGIHGGLMSIGRCIMNSPELKLTNDQRAKLLGIRDELIADRETQGPKFKTLRDDAIKAFADPKASKDQVKAKVRAIGDEMRAAMDRKLDTVMKVRDVLTPEQLAMIPDLSECQGRFGGHDGRGRRGGPDHDPPPPDGPEAW